MTKASPILFCAVAPLQQLPPAEVEVVRRFLFEHIRGMDRANDRRWRRLWGQVWRSSPGEGFQVYSAEQRGGPFHRMHRAVLTRLFDSQDRYPSIDALHDWIKLRCWFVDWVEGKPRPRSTSFDAASEDDIREFHAAMEDLLRQPSTGRRFWPHLTVPQRHEMVDAILRDPKENT